MIFSCYNSDKSHYYSRLDGFSPFSDCAKPKKYFFHRILWCSSQASPTEDEALSDERSAVFSLESLEFCHMDKKQPKTPNPPSKPKKNHPTNPSTNPKLTVLNLLQNSCSSQICCAVLGQSRKMCFICFTASTLGTSPALAGADLAF